MTRRIGIVLMVLVLSCGCEQATRQNKPAPDPRIAELEAEIKRLKSGNKSLDSHKSAVRELKKINSVTEIGVSYSDYRKILLEVKPAFDEFVSDIPTGEIKNGLSLALKAYVDAGTFWNLGVQRGDKYGQMFISVDEIGQFKDYNLGFRGDSYVFWESALPKIWAVASANLAATEELIR